MLYSISEKTLMNMLAILGLFDRECVL